jgi:hypothetical protein
MTRSTKTALVALAFVAALVGVMTLLSLAASFLPAPRGP